MAIKQKVVSIQADEAHKINKYLDEGWTVVQMINEYVSVTSGSFTSHINGKIVFLIQMGT